MLNTASHQQHRQAVTIPSCDPTISAPSQHHQPNGVVPAARKGANKHRVEHRRHRPQQNKACHRVAFSLTMRTLDALSLAACLCVVAGGAMAAGRPPVLARAPQATAKKQHYTVEGSIDVFTYENTLFYWRETMYVLENIPCKYADHASRWFPEYANNSYARVRELASGRVVANISSTIGWGFISAFTDYSNDRVWLFGTHANRCNGNGRGKIVAVNRAVYPCSS